MRVLLVEDDRNLCESLTFQLEKEGFSVDVCHDGEDALHFIKQDAYDLILLDRMIPGKNGIQVLRSLRKDGIRTPLILITALGELSDKIDGLDSGADDYIVKPFAFAELMARIRSISRRPVQWTSTELLTVLDITLDIQQNQLTSGNHSCSLSKRETHLLETFLRNPDQILPRSVLLARVWGPDAAVEDGNLDNYIHFLRRRLRFVKSNLNLKTIRGVGYRLENSDV
jgi:DNA-binding response OmpR family regulator